MALCWVNIGQYPDAHPAAHSLLSPMRQGENRRKARRFVDQDNDILIGKAKAVHASKAKEGITALLPISRQISSCFLASRASACMALAWKYKHRDHEYPHFLLCHLSDHCWALRPVFWNTPLVGAGCLSQLCHQSHAHSQPVHWSGAGQRGHKRRPCCCASPVQQ